MNHNRENDEEYHSGRRYNEQTERKRTNPENVARRRKNITQPIEEEQEHTNNTTKQSYHVLIISRIENELTTATKSKNRWYKRP